MAEDLPTDYDGIVIGTGMTESIIAAALARIGYSVLHIDREDHYSADWSTFNFRCLQEWIKKHKNDVSLSVPDSEKIKSLLTDEETILPLNVEDETFTNIEEIIYVKEKVEKVTNDLPLLVVGADADNTISEDIDNSHQLLDIKPAVNNERHTAEIQPASEEAAKQLVPVVIEDGENVAQNEHAITSTAEQLVQDSIETTTTIVEDQMAKHDNVKKQSVGASNENIETIAEDAPTTSEQVSNNPVQDANKENQESKHDTELKKWTLENIKKEWRHFNIDISPKVLHCSGDMVKLLINSDVAKYCEFKTITRVLTIQDDKIVQVPCSRADVFDCKYVSMIEKRMMMKFLQFCAEYKNKPEQYQDYENKPFEEFLKSQKLSTKIQHFIQHAIAMAGPQTTTLEALAVIQKFLQSLGKYGNTAFLWPMYGSGELPQCFCRMCAVFGGIYYLQKAPVKLILDKDKKYDGIIDSDGLRLRSKWLILNNSYASESILPKTQTKRFLSRAILLVNHSLLKDWTEHISLLHLPVSEVNSEPVTIFELSYVSQACPKNLYVIHLTTVCQTTAQKDLIRVVEKLFQFPQDGAIIPSEDERPFVLWSVYFNTTDNTALDLSSESPENVFITGGAGPSIDCDHCVQEARSIFEKICPDEEFLPKAPNPEDIIYYDENGELGTADGGKDISDEHSKETEEIVEQEELKCQSTDQDSTCSMHSEKVQGQIEENAMQDSAPVN